MPKYAIGVDFGTLSARALVAEIGTGRELASATMDYPHAVMDRELPDGTPLRPDWALQHPQDYLDCLKAVIPAALEKAGVNADDVVGVGVDFTCNTQLPIDADGNPLCLRPEFASNPNAWPMLWKHHAAQKYASYMEKVANERGETFLARYGGKVSSEWMFPRLLQLLNEAPEVCEAADRIIEAGDWIVMQLTGKEARSACMAGYKAFWHADDGYPCDEFLAALHPGLPGLVHTKLGSEFYAAGVKAGEIDARGAQLSGLNPATAVAPASIDAHVAFPAIGTAEPGKLLMILGTSACHLLLGDEEHTVPGMCGVVKGGMTPDTYGYECGQNCCGDHFKWLIENFLPRRYEDEAAARGMNIHALLTEKASKLRPGESGLLALDWWNGNRSVLVDADLTGMLLGMTLATRPEEIYRALIEALAFGTRVIVENFEKYGVKVDELFACGGIAKKNPMLMQIYADVLGRPLRVARSTQAPALGSAMYGATAAGKANGGYDSISDAAREMGGADEKFYSPIPENQEIYDQLYAEYVRLHDYFGRGENDVMKVLKAGRARSQLLPH